ncbi:MAG: porin [Planctomycetota bacterium]
MTMRLKSAIGTMAAAFLLGGHAIGQEPAPPTAAPAPLTESGPIQIDVPYSELEAEAEEEGAELGFLNKFLFGEAFVEKTGLSLSGWAVGSFTYNANNPSDRMNGPVTFNDRANDVLGNQLYLIGERKVDSEGDKIDLGFRVDALYGSDAVFTQAFGLDADIFTSSPLYRLALPQIYGELFLPIGDGMSVKGGHFYTILGYEVVTTPTNFFTTLPYTFQYGEPFTHTGVLSSWKLGEKLTWHNAVVGGWDTWWNNNNCISYMGGFSYQMFEKTNITLTYITGPVQDERNDTFTGIRDPGNGVNRFLYSLVIQQGITEKLKYVLQHDYGIQDASPGGVAGNGAAIAATPHAEWYGINQYLFYDINEKFAVGVRGEWFRDDDGQRVAVARAASTLSPITTSSGVGAVPFGPGNYYALSLGANYRPMSSFTIRPELRWDWQDADANAGTTRAFSAGTKRDQFLMAIDFILTF